LYGAEAGTTEKVTRKLRGVGADEVLQIGTGVSTSRDSSRAPENTLGIDSGAL
jgi:hypothetical protein